MRDGGGWFAISFGINPTKVCSTCSAVLSVQNVSRGQMVAPRRSVPAQTGVGATLMHVRSTAELCPPVTGDLVPNQAVLPGAMTSCLTWVSTCWAPSHFWLFMLLKWRVFSKAREGAALGMVMQRLVQTEAFLGQIVRILEGVWSLSFLASMKCCSLFLLKRCNLIFSCKNAVQK